MGGKAATCHYDSSKDNFTSTKGIRRTSTTRSDRREDPAALTPLFPVLFGLVGATVALGISAFVLKRERDYWKRQDWHRPGHHPPTPPLILAAAACLTAAVKQGKSMYGFGLD